MGLFPHIEYGAIPASAQDVLVQTALATLTLRPEPGEFVLYRFYLFQLEIRATTRGNIHFLNKDHAGLVGKNHKPIFVALST